MTSLTISGFSGRTSRCKKTFAPASSSEAISFKLKKSVCQDIESTNWHYKSEHHSICGTESGIMYGFDTRSPGKPVFEVKAHKKACTSVDFSPHIPSMVASVGVDKICRIWDVNQRASTGG